MENENKVSLLELQQLQKEIKYLFKGNPDWYEVAEEFDRLKSPEEIDLSKRRDSKMALDFQKSYFTKFKSIITNDEQGYEFLETLDNAIMNYFGRLSQYKCHDISTQLNGLKWGQKLLRLRSRLRKA